MYTLYYLCISFFKYFTREEPFRRPPILFYMVIVSMSATIFEINQPYLTWKGRGLFANSIGVTAGNRRPLTNNDASNNTLQHFGLPRPIKHYRRGYSIGTSPSTTSSTGGHLVSQLIDTPGGYILQENKEKNVACNTCQGIAVTSEWEPNTNLSETPSPQTQTTQFCCNQEKNALKLVRSAKTHLNPKYYTSAEKYLRQRCRLFNQNQYNYLSNGNPNGKPGAPNTNNNSYKSNCNPNVYNKDEDPLNTTGCQNVVYKPSNYQYAKQGAVSSSDRMLKLNLDTINKNRKSTKDASLLKAKVFPNTSRVGCQQPCIIINPALL